MITNCCKCFSCRKLFSCNVFIFLVELQITTNTNCLGCCVTKWWVFVFLLLLLVNWMVKVKNTCAIIMGFIYSQSQFRTTFRSFQKKIIINKKFRTTFRYGNSAPPCNFLEILFRLNFCIMVLIVRCWVHNSTIEI